jgi:hypothetical protein
MSDPSHVERKALDLADGLHSKKSSDDAVEPTLSQEARATLALTYATLAIVEQLRRMRSN